jgi:hypothetical protein
MWRKNQKRLDDLEKRIASIEDKRVYIPSNREHREKYGDWTIPAGKFKPVTIPEVVCIILDYLHIRCHEVSESMQIFGKLEDTNG